MARFASLSFAFKSLARHVKDPTPIRTSITTSRTAEFWRCFSLSSTNLSNGGKPQAEAQTISITFLDRDGDRRTVSAKEGELLLDVAKNNDVDLEGACEGTLSCSTCHLIFDPKDYDNLDLSPPDDEELDMLDLAYGLTDTSRLGCQIEVTEKLDGITLKVPEATRDARE